MATPQTAPPINNVFLKDMKPGQRGITSEVIVIKKEAEPVVTREGDTIYKYVIADKTGSMSSIIWHIFGKYVRIGDILRVQDCECKLRDGRVLLSVLRTSKLKRTGQDTLVFMEEPNFSEQSMQNQPMPQMHQQQQQHQLQFQPQQQLQQQHQLHYQQQQQPQQLQPQQQQQPQPQQQRMPYPRTRPSPQQQQHRGGYRGRGRDPRQRGRSTPQPQ